MGKTKRRDKKRKRRGPKKSSGGGGGGGGGGGTMMGLRSGFKAIAGPVVGNEARDRKGKRVANVFWTIIMIAAAVVLAYFLYTRYA